MIITSVAPYVKSIPKNFAEDWNRNNLTSRGFYEFGSTNDLDREWSDVLGVNTDKLEEFNTAMYDLIMQRQP